MKSLKLLTLLLFGLFVVTACQKEYSVETGSLGGLAEGTLKDSLGDCSPISIRGTYYTDSTLSDSNYVIVQVNVTTAGNYVISTDLQNGYAFRDSGYFATTGILNIKLKGTGRPILPITSDFTVSFGTASFCLFSVAVLPNPGVSNATYTLSGTSTNCTNAIVQGNYTTNTALNNTNTVNIEVNVSQVGSYSISTTPTNGMIFFKSGSFTTTGIQTVTLQSSGTPLVAGASIVPISAGGTSCSFTVNVVDGNVNQADTAWQFKQGGNLYYGSIDSVVFSKVNSIDVLQMYGYTATPSDSIFILGMGMTSNTIASGTYHTNTFAAFNFSDSLGNVVYQANPTALLPPVDVTIVLNYDSTTKIAQGTFSGTAQNNLNVAVPITAGKFKIKVP